MQKAKLYKTYSNARRFNKFDSFFPVTAEGVNGFMASFDLQKRREIAYFRGSLGAGAERHYAIFELMGGWFGFVEGFNAEYVRRSPLRDGYGLYTNLSRSKKSALEYYHASVQRFCSLKNSQVLENRIY